MSNGLQIFLTSLRLVWSRVVLDLFITPLSLAEPTLILMALEICRPPGAQRPSPLRHTPHMFPKPRFTPTGYESGCMRTFSLVLSLLSRLNGPRLLWLTPPTKTTIGAPCTAYIRTSPWARVLIFPVELIMTTMSLIVASAWKALLVKLRRLGALRTPTPRLPHLNFTIEAVIETLCRPLTLT